MEPMPECPGGGVDHSCLFHPMELRKEILGRSGWSIFIIGHQNRFDFAVVITVVIAFVTSMITFFDDLDSMSMTVILLINSVCLDYT
jgi:hypothetical protein